MVMFTVPDMRLYPARLNLKFDSSSDATRYKVRSCTTSAEKKASAVGGSYLARRNSPQHNVGS